jgi:hypothetical protein
MQKVIETVESVLSFLLNKTPVNSAIEAKKLCSKCCMPSINPNRMGAKIFPLKIIARIKISSVRASGPTQKYAVPLAGRTKKRSTDFDASSFGSW